MWQHRQEDRDLKRAEMDLIKQKKQVQRSMKEYEASELKTEGVGNKPSTLQAIPITWVLIGELLIIGELLMSLVQW